MPGLGGGGEVKRLLVTIDASGAQAGAREFNAAAGSLSGGLGGISSKAALAGAAIVGVVAAVAAAKAALSATVSLVEASVGAWDRQEKAIKQVEARLRSTQGAVGLTSKEIQKMAASIQHSTGIGDEAILEMQSLLLTFPKVTGAAFEPASKAILDMATAMGTDLKSAAIQVGKALNDPASQMTALSRAGIVFTKEQKEVIRSMQQAGDLAGAQALILKELQKEFGGAAEAARDTFGGALAHLNGLIGDFLEYIGKQITPYLRAVVEELVRGGEEFGQYGEQIGEALAAAVQYVIEFGSAFLMIAGAVGQGVGSILHSLSTLLSAVADIASKLPGFSADAIKLVRDASAGAERMGSLADVAGKAMGDLGARIFTAVQNVDKYRVASEQAAPSVGDLADETENAGKAALVAFTGFEKLATAVKDLDALAASAQFMGPNGLVPKGLTDEYQKFLEMTGALKDYNSDQEVLNRLVAARVITEQQAADALRLQAEGMIEVKKGAKDTNDEMDEFLKKVRENFVEGLQRSFTTFFVDVFEGGEDAMKNFGDALKKLLINAAAEWLSKMLLSNLKIHIDNMRKILTENAARKAGGASGGGGGGGADASSAVGAYKGLSSSGYASAAYAVAALAAVVAIAKWFNDQKSKKLYGTVVGAKVEDGGISASFYGRLKETGAKVTAAIAGLLGAFQESTGAFITGLAQAQIRIRNDKKSFEATVNNEVIGVFKTAEEAIIAAAKKMFLSADLSRTLAPEVQQVIQNYQGTDPEELAKAVATVQGIVDKVAGLTDIEIALRNLPQQTAALAAELRNMGVSLIDSQKLAAEWRVNELNSIRDQITGHQRTAAEERAIRERQAAMFNAEVTLMRAELETKRADLEARKALLQSDRGLAIARAELGKGQAETMVRIIQTEAELYSTRSGIYRAGIESQGEFNKFLGGMFNSELSIRQQYADFSQDILDTMLSNLDASLAAVDAILANLPELIDPKEIQIGGGAGGGKGVGAGAGPSGPSKADRREALLAELEQVARSLEDEFIAQLAELDEWLARTTEEALALGLSLEQINELYARQREELIASAQAEVAQYTQNPYSAALAGILEWGARMTEVYEALGLSLEEVEQAEQARIDALLAQAEAALGIPVLSDSIQQMADAMAFLQQALDEGIISAEDYADAIYYAQLQASSSLIDSLLQFTDNEEARAMLEQARYELAIAQIMLEFEAMQALGLLTEDVIALIQGIIDGLPSDFADLNLGGGGYSGGGGYYGGGGGSETDAAMERLTRALERLAEYYESLQQDTSVSPLSLAERYAAAQADYNALIQQINTTTDPEERAALIEQLPQVAQQYLELAAQMFGTATQGYQDIFNAVLAQLELILGGYQEPNEWQWLQTGVGAIRGHLMAGQYEWEQQTAFLWNIRDLLEAGSGAAGTAGASGESALARGVAAGSDGVVRNTRDTVDAIHMLREESVSELRAIRSTITSLASRGASAYERRLESGARTVN